jgi:hypothetical protein
MTTICLQDLKANATDLIANAVRKLLSLPSTQQTVAQIIDDMPIRRHHYGLDYPLRHPHPDIERRSAPSDDATQLAEKLCSELDLSTLTVDTQVNLPEPDLCLMLTIVLPTKRPPKDFRWN